MQESRLDRHLAALEMQNRRLRQLLKLSSVGLIMLSATILIGWKKVALDVVRATKLEIVNDQGKVVGIFGQNEKGGAKFEIFNHQNVRILEAGETLNSASGLTLNDKQGIRRFSVGSTMAQSDNYMLSLAGKAGGQNQIHIGEFGAQGSGIQMFHASEGYPLVRMMVTGNKSSEIGMTQVGGGGLTLKSSPTEANISFTNMIHEGSSSRLVSTLHVNKPAGYVMQNEFPRETAFWPGPPKN